MENDFVFGVEKPLRFCLKNAKFCVLLHQERCYKLCETLPMTYWSTCCTSRDFFLSIKTLDLFVALT